MGQPSSKDEMTIRHQFDRLCQMALKGEAVNYYKHMDYRRKHEVTFSELSEKELSKLFTMDEYGTEYHHFEVHGYDIEVKNTLIAEALKELTERKRNVILLSYTLKMGILLRCVQLGISIRDLDLLAIGLVNDMYAENSNDDYKGDKEVATQDDFDKF